MKQIPAAALLLFAFAANQLFAFERGPSTQAERDRLVGIADALEKDPAAPSLRGDREWALKFLIAVPDIHVKICTGAMKFVMDKKKYKYGSDLFGLGTIAAGRFAIQHPDAGDQAQALATAEAVLNGYQHLVAQDPKAQFKEADEMLAKRDEKKLAEAVGSCEGK